MSHSYTSQAYSTCVNNWIKPLNTSNQRRGKSFPHLNFRNMKHWSPSFTITHDDVSIVKNAMRLLWSVSMHDDTAQGTFYINDTNYQKQYYEGFYFCEKDLSRPELSGSWNKMKLNRCRYERSAWMSLMTIASNGNIEFSPRAETARFLAANYILRCIEEVVYFTWQLMIRSTEQKS